MDGPAKLADQGSDRRRLVEDAGRTRDPAGEGVDAGGGELVVGQVPGVDGGVAARELGQ